MIKESDLFREQNNLLEFQLEKLGVSAKKLKQATHELDGDRGYVRTEERERVINALVFTPDRMNLHVIKRKIV